jgi:NAD(P)-dependent dehydrogenase (short-subunit alcohol dehydrogenase family)
MDIKDKIAVITGTSKGIGFELAKQLLQKGARVYGLGRNKPDNLPITFVPCDIRNAEDVEVAFAAILKKEKAIHILINNSGVGYFGMLEDITYQQWHDMFDTNINGMFYCCKAVIPSMKEQQYGHIINIASTAALEGMPQVSAYCATKWAVKGLSESLFREVRDFKIKVTCVYPGSTRTDFFRNSPSIKPHDYMLMPEDVALGMIQAIEMPDNFHTANWEIRPLQPKGPKV